VSAATIARARAVAGAFMRGESVPQPPGGIAHDVPEETRRSAAYAAGCLAVIAEELAFRLEKAEARLDALGEPHL